ncbi:sensor histidine kinase [Dactylosporangium sp. CA-139066]|uniref:sensor histidine kinase n=1 Tax=Dactylosporangium sp. CA-139066 TaxID=3239930 RepID=UPI003D924EEF
MMQGRLAAWLVRPSPPPATTGIAVGAGFVVVETLLVYPLRQTAPVGALAVVYLLGVVVVSTVWGLWLGVATSILSAIAFDYFHTPPVGRFETEDWRDWLGLSVYLMVAGVASSVAQLARARAVETVERRRETDTVAELTRLILGADDVAAVLPEASDRIAHAMQLPWAQIELGTVPHSDGRIQLPLQPGALVVPADLPDRTLRRLRDGVVPGLATVLRAGRSLQASRAESAALLNEQAVLRRVAVLVATGVAPAEIVAAVAAEAAELFNADATAVVRWEGGRTVAVVAEYTRKPGAESMLGKRLDSAGGVSEMVLRDSRPARMDAYDGRSGQLADLARAMGFYASVGAPIVVDGKVWGVLVALWGRGGAPPPDIEQELAQFTDLVATAIANTESRAELNASRTRLVFAADEARRGIERDLHDSVQQRLVSLGLELRAAEELVPPDAGELRSRLSSTAAGLSGVFDDLQRIVRGIHPAILSQGGLGPAIKALARRCPVPTVVSPGPNRRLPSYVEVAAYYVVSEALANSVKHAGATAIDVELDIVPAEPAVDGAAQGEVVRVTVRDDGAGGADPRHGSGLAGLRDRVEALGGTLTVSSPAGRGTSLSAQLPVDGQCRQREAAELARPR